jgi:hypothetical protein
MSDDHPESLSTANPGAGYVAPKIEWEEVLEEAGVYAACVKDEFGNPTPACIPNPMAASTS